jgi:signal transduction histidine kinase
MFAGMGPQDDPLSWPQRVDKETLVYLTSGWDQIIRGDQRETQMTWKWLTGKTVSATFIRLDKVYPAMSGILGCLSDISYQEERMQEAKRRRREAEESKTQQELLVDVTSHEIRTPVSAILHCSSPVKENLGVVEAQLHRGVSLEPSRDLVQQFREDIEALESESISLTGLITGIHQCGLVQERIANDVLSLARVQLDMLTYYDVDVDLRRQAQKVGAARSSVSDRRSSLSSALKQR